MPRLEGHCWSCSCSTRVKSKYLSSATWLASKAGEMMTIISALLSQAYGSLHQLQAANLLRRGLVLFTVGVFLALVLNLLQVQRNVTLFPEEVLATLFSSAWWVPLCCGTAAAVVGLLYPCIDSHLGEPHKFKREWASVMRCIAVFVGINHASAKLDFANNVQLSLTLAALSLGLWWTFDRSRSGFGLGITIAFLATLITQFLVYNGVYQ
ncbi:INSI1 protein, partial [Atractosteus spatula]|nr:INSI1 protein [Atractosteus spatula]